MSHPTIRSLGPPCEPEISCSGAHRVRLVRRPFPPKEKTIAITVEGRERDAIAQRRPRLYGRHGKFAFKKIKSRKKRIKERMRRRAQPLMKNVQSHHGVVTLIGEVRPKKGACIGFTYLPLYSPLSRFIGDHAVCR